MTKLFAISTTASRFTNYADRELSYAAGYMVAQNSDEAMGKAYKQSLVDYPQNAMWKTYVAVTEIPKSVINFVGSE